MKNIIEYILFRAFGLLFVILGLNKARKFSRFLALFFYYFIPIRKKTVIENLSRAFPDYSEDKINQIAFESYISFTITIAEMFIIPSLSEDEIKAIVTVKNPEFFHQKLNEQNGMILLSAHFANWELGAISLSLHVKTPFFVVVKNQRNGLVDKWMKDMRSRWLNVVVPLGISIRNIFTIIKEKKVAALVADQRGPSDGIDVNLFGIPSKAHSGPALLSLKTNAPILYAIGVRNKQNNYDIEFVEISRDNLPENEEDKIRELTQRQFDYLEKFIREYPEQWLWMHKRWKY